MPSHVGSSASLLREQYFNIECVWLVSFSLFFLLLFLLGFLLSRETVEEQQGPRSQESL